MVVHFNGSTQLYKPQFKARVQNQQLQFQGSKLSKVSFGDSEEIKQSPPEKIRILPNLIKGMLNPIKDIYKALVEAPLATGMIIAATAAVIAAIPILGTILAVGICGLGIAKMGKGTITAIKDHKKGDNAKANKDIQLVGEGIFDTALTARAACKGLQQVGNTINAITEATKKAVADGGNVGFYKKLYAIVQQIQKSDPIPSGPSTFNEFIQRIKEDGLRQIATLRDMITGKSKPVNIPRVEELINKIDEGNAQDIAKALQGIAERVKNDSSTKKYLMEIVGAINGGQVKQIVQNKDAIIGTLNQSTLDALAKDPELIKIVNKVMKSAKPDETVSLIKRVVKAPQSDEAAKVLGATEVTSEENR